MSSGWAALFGYIVGSAMVTLALWIARRRP